MGVLKLLKNEVVNLSIGKYFSLGLQLIIIALIGKFYGAELIGVWGFSKLIIQLFNYADLGLQFNLPLIISKGNLNQLKINHLFIQSLKILLLISVSLLFILIIYLQTDFNLGNKYNLDTYILPLTLVIIVQLFNKVFLSFYRCMGGLKRVSLFNYFPYIPILFIFFFADSNNFMFYAMWSLFFGHILVLFNFILGRKLGLKREVNKTYTIKYIIKSGLLLTYYNLGLRSLNMLFMFLFSYWFSTEYFGYITLANNLAEGLILGISSVSFAVLPKLISTFSNQDKQFVTKKVKEFFNKKNDLTFLFYILSVVFAYIISSSSLFNTYTDQPLTIFRLFVIFMSGFFLRSIGNSLVNFFLAKEKYTLLGNIVFFITFFSFFLVLLFKSLFNISNLHLVELYLIANLLFAVVIIILYLKHFSFKLNKHKYFFHYVILITAQCLIIVNLDLFFIAITLIILYIIYNGSRFKNTFFYLVNFLNK